MAKQIGNMPVKGTMNNMTYYTSQDGIMVKMKSTISKEKFKTKAFEITFRNNLEFGLAGRASKTLRYAVANALDVCKDRRLSSRLLTLMLKIAKTDSTSVHGERNVAMGELEMLSGFNFNVNSPLALHFTAPFTTAVDRTTGKLTLDIPVFSPQNTMLVPEGATHFKIISAGTEVDFPNDSFSTRNFESPLIPVAQPATTLINVQHQLTPDSTLPFFLLLGFRFFYGVNGAYSPIRNSDANPMAIVKLDVPN